MLTLPYRFCRLLKDSCESAYYRPYVREFLHSALVKKSCCDNHITFFKTSLVTSHHHRLFAIYNKKSHLKIPPQNSNAAKADKPMSESVQPTVNHVSFGGQFEVSTASNLNQCQAKLAEHGSAANSKGRCGTLHNLRIWENVEKRSSSNDGMLGANVLNFKVMSYNVLAQYLLECHPHLYTNCSPANLKWDVRSARLYDEIVQLSPDILCLQEVQASHLSTFYSKFENIGYCGIFKQKTGHREDGCAIYFKKSMFESKEHLSVEYYQPELPILNRDNIGVLVKLVPRAMPASPLVIATTHLLYNPRRTDVRLAQMQLLLAEIDRFAYFNTGREEGHLPIIMTGDLNSPPDSAVIKLLDRGHVSASPFRDSSDWERIGVTDNCQHLTVFLDRREGKTTDFSTTKIHNSDWGEGPGGTGYDRQATPPGSEYGEMFNGAELGHKLRLVSAYDKVKPDGSCEASTFQDFWVTVDYIYFSWCSSLRLSQRLRLPTSDECSALGLLPNDSFGSDHLSLAALFELRPVKSSL